MNGCFDLVMVILVAVLSVCLSSVILNVCARVFGMFVHVYIALSITEDKHTCTNIEYH